MHRFALLLAYNGAGFHGWWRQSGQRSVADTVDAALKRLGETGSDIIGCSRTDAGVHAHGQVAHVDLQRPWDPKDLRRHLDAQFPHDLICRGIARVPEDWHACHDAIGKTYRYRLDVGIARDPFLAPVISWRTPFPLQLTELQKAARLVPRTCTMVGFARRGEHRQDLSMDLDPILWYEADRYLVCRIRGRRFTYRAVRSLVGGMVASAQGTVSLQSWKDALAGTVNPAGQQQAPARGLCLERVHYAKPPIWA